MFFDLYSLVFMRFERWSIVGRRVTLLGFVDERLSLMEGAEHITVAALLKAW